MTVSIKLCNRTPRIMSNLQIKLLKLNAEVHVETNLFLVTYVNDLACDGNNTVRVGAVNGTLAWSPGLLVFNRNNTGRLKYVFFGYGQMDCKFLQNVTRDGHIPTKMKLPLFSHTFSRIV